MNYQKPHKTVCPLAIGLSWKDGAIYQQKLDGKFSVRAVAGGILAGELVGQSFIAFDVLEYGGADVRRMPLIERIKARDALCRSAGLPIVPEVKTCGGEFLERILANGGEGVVRKELHSTYYDTMTACKRIETFCCIVTGFNAGQSVALRFIPPFLDIEKMTPFLDVQNFELAGNMPLRGGKADCVRVGSILKVEAYGRHASGLLREARPCNDTPTSWLIKF